MKNHKILTYSSIVALLYLVMVLSTWFIFSDHGITTLGSALAGSVVYVFYIVIVFGALVLASVVAFMLRSERDTKAH